MLRIEVLIDAHAELGEGPLWDVAEQRLFWIDSLGAKVHSCDATGGAQRSWDVPEHIGSLAMRKSGDRLAS
jgi:L-arabinonolactonase